MITCLPDKTSHPHRTTVLTLVLCAGIAMAASSAYAQNATYTHRGNDGTITFSDAPIKNGQVVRTSYKASTRTPVVANPCHGQTNSQLDAKGHKLDDWFAQAGRTHDIDAMLLKAVARAESCFNPNAVSKAGATGLMQLMPPTAKALQVNNIFDARENLNGGARYLASMLSRYSDNLDLALAAYNAGPGNVDRYDGVPPFDETVQYIASVKAHRARYKSLQPIAAKSE